MLPVVGGGGEIRTLEALSNLPPFQGGALDHYATPPVLMGFNLLQICTKCYNFAMAMENFGGGGQDDSSKGKVTKAMLQAAYDLGKRYGINPPRGL